MRLGRAELGNSLGSLTDGVLGKFSREHQTDSGLDLSRGKSGLLVVSGKLSSLGGDTLKDIVDEGVHDGHSLLGDTGIGVDLLQHLVDVRRVGLGALLGLLSSARLLGRGGLLGALLAYRRAQRVHEHTRNNRDRSQYNKRRLTGCLGHLGCLGCYFGCSMLKSEICESIVDGG